jgi:hypothetical protein
MEEGIVQGNCKTRSLKTRIFAKYGIYIKEDETRIMQEDAKCNRARAYTRTTWETYAHMGTQY